MISDLVYVGGGGVFFKGRAVTITKVRICTVYTQPMLGEDQLIGFLEHPAHLTFEIYRPAYKCSFW